MLEAIEFNDKSVIFATQNALNKAGFNCGMADGVAGTNTINAITQYQVDRGLEPTGQIDEELLVSLGFSVGNPVGVDVSSFVARYNESAVYFNNISIESGDPIHQLIKWRRKMYFRKKQHLMVFQRYLLDLIMSDLM